MKYISAMMIWVVGVAVMGFIFRINYEIFMLGWGLL